MSAPSAPSVRSSRAACRAYRFHQEAVDPDRGIAAGRRRATPRSSPRLGRAIRGRHRANHPRRLEAVHARTSDNPSTPATRRLSSPSRRPHRRPFGTIRGVYPSSSTMRTSRADRSRCPCRSVSGDVSDRTTVRRMIVTRGDPTRMAASRPRILLARAAEQSPAHRPLHLRRARAPRSPAPAPVNQKWLPRPC